jgi:hypothetical protein
VFDGDKLLVTNHPVIIKTAERINKKYDVVPLFYIMSKAKAEMITPDNLYKGLSLAFTGGNIGAPSNDITKIWNSGEITNSALDVVKWLVATVNFTIDYAKTLYKPEPPQDVQDTIKEYTKAKVPYFFKYAKNKKDNQIEDSNTSVVNRIEALFPSRKLNYNFSKSNIGKFDYRMLMNNPEVNTTGVVYDKFKSEIKHIKFSDNIDKLSADDKSMGNFAPVYEEVRNSILQYGRELGMTDFEVVDEIVYGLFKGNKSANKKAFWEIFGEIVYQNICANLGDKFIQCDRCKKRFYTLTPDDKVCDKCHDILDKKDAIVSYCSECGSYFEQPKPKGRPMSKCHLCKCDARQNSKYIWDVVNRK